MGMIRRKQLDARPAGDQEVVGSNPAGSATFLEVDEVFSSVILTFCCFKKCSCQFLAKECAQYWLTT